MTFCRQFHSLHSNHCENHIDVHSRPSDYDAQPQRIELDKDVVEVAAAVPQHASGNPGDVIVLPHTENCRRRYCL